MDTNHDGSLDLRELQLHLRDHRCDNLPEVLVARVLKSGDHTWEGHLDFEEFYTMSLQQEWLPISRFMTKYCGMIVPSPGRIENDAIGICFFAIFFLSPLLSFFLVISSFKYQNRNLNKAKNYNNLFKSEFNEKKKLKSYQFSYR